MKCLRMTAVMMTGDCRRDRPCVRADDNQSHRAALERRHETRGRQQAQAKQEYE